MTTTERVAVREFGVRGMTCGSFAKRVQRRWANSRAWSGLR